MEGVMATSKTKKSTVGELSSELLTGLMTVADIKFKGKGEVPRDKVATLARKKMKEQRLAYQAMRRQIRAARFIGKLATADSISAEDIESVQSLLTGKSTVSSEEFSDFTI
jgi:hypothetical protein